MNNAASIRVLVVDDEPLAREWLVELLQDQTGVEVVGQCADGKEALQRLRRGGVDLAFLDIRMPGLSGLEVMERLPAEARPLIVFVTAYDEYAVRAFAVQAFDYVLKPYNRERLLEALERARAQLQLHRRVDLTGRLEELLHETQAAPADHLAVRSGDRYLIVRCDDILWVEADRNYVELHTASGSHRLRESLGALESRLKGGAFLRISRSALVRLDAVREVQPWFRGDYLVVLKDGHKLTLTRRYRDNFKKLLG
jgi:two-component system LytT family response regulator